MGSGSRNVHGLSNNHPLWVLNSVPSWNSMSQSPVQRRAANKVSTQSAGISRRAFCFSSLFSSFVGTLQLNSTGPPAPQDNLNNVYHELSKPLPAFGTGSWIQFLTWKSSFLLVGTEVSTTTVRRNRTTESGKQFRPFNLTILFPGTGHTEPVSYAAKEKCKRKFIFILYNGKNWETTYIRIIKEIFKRLYLIREYYTAVQIN